MKSALVVSIAYDHHAAYILMHWIAETVKNEKLDVSDWTATPGSIEEDEEDEETSSEEESD